MKKILSLAFLCMCFCATCSAYYAPNTNQYEWVTSDSKSTDYFDKWGVQPNREKKIVTFNLLSCYPANNNHAIIKVLVDYNTKTTTYLEGKLYDDNTKAVIKDLNGSPDYNKALPFTATSQKWADQLFIYVR